MDTKLNILDGSNNLEFPNGHFVASFLVIRPETCSWLVEMQSSGSRATSGPDSCPAGLLLSLN